MYYLIVEMPLNDVPLHINDSTQLIGSLQRSNIQEKMNIDVKIVANWRLTIGK